MPPRAKRPRRIRNARSSAYAAFRPQPTSSLALQWTSFYRVWDMQERTQKDTVSHRQLQNLDIFSRLHPVCAGQKRARGAFGSVRLTVLHLSLVVEKYVTFQNILNFQDEGFDKILKLEDVEMMLTQETLLELLIIMRFLPFMFENSFVNGEHHHQHTNNNISQVFLRGMFHFNTFLQQLFSS